MTATLDLSLTADVAEIARVAEAIEAFCADHGLSPRIAFDLNLAVDELATNTISYGFAGRADDGRIRLRLALTEDDDGGAVVASLDDDGLAYDPFTQAPPPVLHGDVEDRPIGGFGVHFARTLMDEVSYRREDGWNRIVLRRRLRPSPT